MKYLIGCYYSQTFMPNTQEIFRKYYGENTEKQTEAVQKVDQNQEGNLLEENPDLDDNQAQGNVLGDNYQAKDFVQEGLA